MARDLEAAQRFYGEVLGWRFRPSELGPEFSVAFLGGRPLAGIGGMAGSLSIPVAWTPYFAVDDADVAAARIRERIGTVAVGPLSFGTGRAALAADPQGAVFGIWEGKAIPDWRSDAEDGGPAWLELRTRDAFAAAIFYGEVLDWASGRPGCVQVSYEGEQVVLRHGGMAVARLSGGAVEEAPDPQVRPRWHVHFRVPDVAAATETAVRLGGSVVQGAPGEAAGRWTTLRDPDGGVFTIGAAGAAAPARPRG
ncbi:VOC family protein [Streptomyces sp. NPDC048604]|uniref:VOC family protein n=1 Tax=Streptomyces sp. NPDC048604 TaxID=3365578 RepID=UPI00371DAC19